MPETMVGTGVTVLTDSYHMDSCETLSTHSNEDPYSDLESLSIYSTANGFRWDTVHYLHYSIYITFTLHRLVLCIIILYMYKNAGSFLANVN